MKSKLHPNHPNTSTSTSFRSVNYDNNGNISRTMRYKKITKPLLERKRRARFNRCVDELKNLMFGALEAEGENIDKLEKADILELTVKHLRRVTKVRDPVTDARRFHAGFSQCAQEACAFLLGFPGLETEVSKRLVDQLHKWISKPIVTYRETGGGGTPLCPIPTQSEMDENKISFPHGISVSTESVWRPW